MWPRGQSDFTELKGPAFKPFSDLLFFSPEYSGAVLRTLLHFTVHMFGRGPIQGGPCSSLRGQIPFCVVLSPKRSHCKGIKRPLRPIVAERGLPADQRTCCISCRWRGKWSPSMWRWWGTPSGRSTSTDTKEAPLGTEWLCQRCHSTTLLRLTLMACAFASWLDYTGSPKVKQTH